MTPGWRRPGPWALTATTLVVLVGCTTGGGTPEATVPDGPYKAQVLRAQQDATSDFERQVLSDGAISAAEYDEAVARYVRCFADQGVTVTPSDIGGYYQYGVAKDEAEKFRTLSESCAKGNTLIIEDLYIQMLTNPSGGDIYDAVAACLVRKGLASESLTGSELKQLQAADPRGANLPYDPEDPEARACEINPEAG